jgi:cytochrome o ubiquinol oxidase subunit 3
MQMNVIKDGKMPPLWHYGHEEHDVIAAKTFGFWLYMLSDALLFAGLFASYA